MKLPALLQPVFQWAIEGFIQNDLAKPQSADEHTRYLKCVSALGSLPSKGCKGCTLVIESG